MRLKKIFIGSKNLSTKYTKYFQVYNELFSKYINKKITFVEIGVLNGGSLQMWRKFFGQKARIIGIDINPICKKFRTKNIEIYIGDQSNPEFWINFFKRTGKVDVILDDGGHTNIQQIITTASTIDKIKCGGTLVIEDTHTSYMKEFCNPMKYSFIAFAKKIIDDINFTFPKIGKFKFSVNKAIYSISFYESITAFHINRKFCVSNKKFINKGIDFNIEDLRYGIKNTQYDTFSKKIKTIVNKIFLLEILIRPFIFLRKKIKNIFDIKKYEMFFK